MFWQPASSLMAGHLDYDGVYDPKLVILSIAIAIFTAYMGLFIAHSAGSVAGRWFRRILIGLGGTVLGVGIWAMHFIGMLGFQLPCLTSYNPWITALSVTPAIAASIYTLNLLNNMQQPSLRTLVVASLWFGLGVGAIHYSGMTAIALQGTIYFHFPFFLLSLLAAVVLSMIALGFRVYVPQIFHGSRSSTLWSSALVMGLATSGIHYIAMRATQFLCAPGEGAAFGQGREIHEVAIAVALSTALLTGMTLLVVLREISNQLQQQKNLARTETWYRKIIEQAPEGIFVLDAQGQIILVNAALAGIFGYTQAELIGQPIAILGLETLIQKSLHLIQTGNELGPNCPLPQQEFEVIATHRNGFEFPIELGLTSLPSLDQKGTNLFAFVRDISARKAAQQELLQQREHLQSVLDSAPVGVAITVDGVTKFANPHIIELVDLKVGDRPQKIYVNLSDRDRMIAELEQTGRTPSRVYKMRGSDGQERDILATFLATTYEGQAGILGWLTDITPIKTAEAEMKRAKELAEEANRMKADFLANMSHEIRTPMNAVIGMTHLALKTELTARQQDYLHKIQTSGQHLLGVINNILDFSKIEAGKLPIESIDFDLDKVLDNVSILMSEKAADKGLELLFDIDRNLPLHFVGDPLRLGQILINYANNAVKFTQSGDITIVMKLQEYHDQDVTLYLAVKDTGIGIKQEHLGSLFNSFQQADSSTTRNFGGTGLGLAICKRIAELMGGTVGVESEYGQGSTFWATVRLRKSNHSPRRLVLSNDLEGKRVLVVDDNDHACLVMKDLLEQMKFVVDTVNTGWEALNLVTERDLTPQPYHIIFVDWQMPNMDGLEVARRLEEMKLQHLPSIFIVTAYGREELFVQAKTLGIADVLIKPVSPSLLFDSLARVLGDPVAEEREPLANTSENPVNEQLKAISGARILLVEDNEINQEVAAELLRDEGFEVDIAANGRIAVEKVQTSDYALVLMDMQMPEMDGIEATIAIRQDPRFDRLPIVAMTANVLQGDRDRCFAAGMNDHLGKPIEPEELWHKLSQWIPATAASSMAETSSPSEPSGAETRGSGIPRQIADLNVDDGLRRVLGKESLYLKMLRKFIGSQQSFLPEITAALAAADYPLAERLAHTLKGVSGNIGAQTLQGEAAVLEKSIKERQPPDEIQGYLSPVGDRLTDLIAQLQAYFPPEVPISSVLVDPVQLDQICDQLAQLLGEDDAEAADFLQEHSDFLRQAFPEHYGAITSGINNFDFEAAQLALTTARNFFKQTDQPSDN